MEFETQAELYDLLEDLVCLHSYVDSGFINHDAIKETQQKIITLIEETQKGTRRQCLQ